MTEEKHEPVILETYGDLARLGYRLDGWCPSCNRHKQIDLAAMPADRPYRTTRLRCTACGGIAEIRLGGPSKLTGQARPA